MTILNNLKVKIRNKNDSQQFFWRILNSLKKTTGDFLRKWTNYAENSSVHIFPEQKVVYVEIPKAGCSSIKRALKDYRGLTDLADHENIHRFYGVTNIPSTKLGRILKDEYADWTKFTVVRNPYNRFRSFYYDKRKLFSDPDASMDSILRNFKKNKWYKDPHGRPQARLLGGDLSAFNFVGHTENMDEVFTFLSKAFGVMIQKRHDHISDNNNRQNDELTKWQEKKIYNLYKSDFKLLGYERSRHKQKKYLVLTGKESYQSVKA